jgi:hypothetical protein
MNGYGLLAQDIILVLLKDYRRADEQERAALRTWPEEENGCVQFCANALGIASSSSAPDSCAKWPRLMVGPKIYE